jgi:predicted nucleic acid-binding protein
VNYLDVAYILRLYVEDKGWEKVRALAAEAPVACSLHGYAEAIAAFHRKHREGVFSLSVYNQVLNQFETDCDHDAYRWLPVSTAVLERVTKAYRKLPPSVFLRASDSLHLACAAVNGLRKVYSNDQRLIAAAPHFGLKGVDILDTR